MRVEIKIKDTAPNGHRLGMKRLYLESCRVYREAGDGLRLNNLAVPVCAYFNALAKSFIEEARNVGSSKKRDEKSSDEIRDCDTDSASRTKEESSPLGE